MTRPDAPVSPVAAMTPLPAKAVATSILSSPVTIYKLSVAVIVLPDIAPVAVIAPFFKVTLLSSYPLNVAAPLGSRPSNISWLLYVPGLTSNTVCPEYFVVNAPFESKIILPDAALT